MHKEQLPVKLLAVYLPNQQLITFLADSTAEDLRARLNQLATTLTAFFRQNADLATGCNLLYQDFPTCFIYYRPLRTQQLQQRSTGIRQIYFCSPLQGEQYYLQLLLTVIQGVQLFADLHTINSVEHPIFQAATTTHSLLLHNSNQVACFCNTATFATGQALQYFFITTLINRPVTNPLAIQTSFYTDLYNNLPLLAAALAVLNNAATHLNYSLYLINSLLTKASKRLTDFLLPACQYNQGVQVQNQLLAAKLAYNTNVQDTVFQDSISSLNKDQRTVFNTVVTAVKTNLNTAHFFI